MHIVVCIFHNLFAPTTPYRKIVGTLLGVISASYMYMGILLVDIAERDMSLHTTFIIQDIIISEPHD